MRDLPVRGPGVRALALALPPGRMAPMRSGRPLKRWRYLGVYRPDLMLCVGDARVAGVPQRWWALALPDGTLVEGSRGVELSPGRARVRGVLELQLEAGEGVEVVSPHGRSYIWTRKQAPVHVSGRVTVAGRAFDIDGDDGFLDESAGYHARHTAWRWSAGLGRTDDGRRVAWNLVDGVHDAPSASERTVWVDGEPAEVGPVDFAADLGSILFEDGARVRFTEWAERRDRTNLLVMRSYYRQPFGTFEGELSAGLTLAEGYGVMEEHEVWW
jgi:hypothetical protein